MFNEIPIKIPMTFITDTEKSTLMFIWKHKRLQIDKAVLSKKSNTKYHNTLLQTILQSHSNKNSMVLAQKQTWRQVEPIEYPDMNPCEYTYLIFDKGAKNIRWRKDSLFNKWWWENWISTCRKLKIYPCLSPCASINSKWIKDLNVKPETLKLVQERAGNTLKLIGIGNNFLNRTQMAQQRRERINKWDYMILKSFCTTEEMVSKLKRLPTE
jgi:hypothetical protein